jgi:hypothetical protein
MSTHQTLFGAMVRLTIYAVFVLNTRNRQANKQTLRLDEHMKHIQKTKCSIFGIPSVF